MSSRAYIYVVHFSTGVIKVGHAFSFKGRLRAHVLDGQRFGVTVADHRHWEIPTSALSSGAEKRLIQAAHDLGGEITRGREYFSNLDFTDIIFAADVIAEQARDSWQDTEAARLTLVA